MTTPTTSETDRRSEFAALAAVKNTVSTHAIRIGDLALGVTGSAGLSRALPLERIYRDIRVSIGQPPIDDAALTIIGRAALGL